MELLIVNFDIKSDGFYCFVVRFGSETFLEEIIIKKGIVVYFEYSEKMQQILCKNVSEAGNFNKLIFDIYKGFKVDFPFYIGDF